LRVHSHIKYLLVLTAKVLAVLAVGSLRMEDGNWGEKNELGTNTLANLRGVPAVNVSGVPSGTPL